jgi:hypothetical protein
MRERDFVSIDMCSKRWEAPLYIRENDNINNRDGMLFCISKHNPSSLSIVQISRPASCNLLPCLEKTKEERMKNTIKERRLEGWLDLKIQSCHLPWLSVSEVREPRKRNKRELGSYMMGDRDPRGMV